MSLHLWLTFAAVAFAVSLVPGPAMLTILGASLSGGGRRGFRALGGILFADVVVFALAALGLGALLLSSPRLFLAVKWAGAAYLAWLGVRALLDRSDAFADASTHSPFRDPALAALTTQLANPKVLVFLAALVPPFIDLHRSAPEQFALLGATFVATDALVFATVIAFAARARRWLRSARARTVARRATGVAMIGAASRVAFE